MPLEMCHHALSCGNSQSCRSEMCPAFRVPRPVWAWMTGKAGRNGHVAVVFRAVAESTTAVTVRCNASYARRN